VTDRFQDGRRRHVGNSSECYKMGNYHPILMQIGSQTKKNMLSLKITVPEVTIKFQDGRRRHIGNWRACYKMGNYHPILMQIGSQTKKSMPSSEITKPETFAKFQDDRRRHFVYWNECYKMGNYDPILMKFDTQTKKNMLGSKVRKAGMIDRFQDGRRRHVGTSMLWNYHRTRWKLVHWLSKICWSSAKVIKAEAYGKKTAKIKCKKRYRFKKATLYEREVIKKQKFFIRRQKLPYTHTTCG
jgi:hypothetical protein